MPDMTVMKGSELAAIIRERVLRDVFPAPDQPTYTYLHPTWSLIWAELRARCGPVRCVFIIVVTIVLWPFQLVWSLIRWLFSKPLFATMVLGGTALWFWSWPGLLVACLFVWLFTLFRQIQKSRSSKEGVGRQNTPTATMVSSSAIEQGIYDRGQEDELQRELDQEFERQQKVEQMIEAVHQQSQYKHIAGRPWGDPSSYVREPTPEELLEQEHKKGEDERSEREAREFLNRESERVLKEREEQHEATQKRESEATAKRPRWLH